MYTEKEFERLRRRGEDYQKQREEEMKGKEYSTIHGVQIVCLQCKNLFFYKGNALLNTRGMTFFGLDWLNEAAVTLICTDCGFIHWFNKDVKPRIQYL